MIKENLTPVFKMKRGSPNRCSMLENTASEYVISIQISYG